MRYVNSRLGSDFLSARQSAASAAGVYVSHGLFSCHCEDHTNEEEEREEKGTAFFGLFGDCGASVYLSRCYDDDDAPLW